MHRFQIREDDLSGADIAALLEFHIAEAIRHSPPASVHAMPIDRLRGPDVTFWSLWEGEALAGCGALKELAPDHGEPKSMRTAPAFLRRGVGEAILLHLIAEARHRGYRRLSLETGRTEPFAAARTLYRKYDFEECPPFGNYRADDFSMCMTRAF
ncbi:GNAT family N-acetyltransferase [Parasphingopyxis lamellibrachiae]|uniref:Putative acetyltransferase n=1 Tax=Parasphingopyxis lamellibrachiae TaxID=680125 RepID=A0A3D9FHL4_9SPHN|nr:GNAT family N-acetyltransferase [Parasphingopyxis lamellibrachiae]RED17284.1 putative acetyltransferase [Parasphingopyxis lamellibrachiae]